MEHWEAEWFRRSDTFSSAVDDWLQSSRALSPILVKVASSVSFVRMLTSRTRREETRKATSLCSVIHGGEACHRVAMLNRKMPEMTRPAVGARHEDDGHFHKTMHHQLEQGSDDQSGGPPVVEPQTLTKRKLWIRWSAATLASVTILRGLLTVDIHMVDHAVLVSLRHRLKKRQRLHKIMNGFAEVLTGPKCCNRRPAAELSRSAFYGGIKLRRTNSPQQEENL